MKYFNSRSSVFYAPFLLNPIIESKICSVFYLPGPDLPGPWLPDQEHMRPGIMKGYHWHPPSSQSFLSPAWPI